MAGQYAAAPLDHQANVNAAAAYLPEVLPTLSRFPPEGYPEFPPQFPPAHPPTTNRRLEYFFFYSSDYKAPSRTVIIYTAADTPCFNHFTNGLLDYLYVPATHALFPYIRVPAIRNPANIVPSTLHWLPNSGPLHLMGEYPPFLPPFLHAGIRAQPNNQGYPNNLVQGQRVHFFFRNGVVIRSTTDNPFNNPLVMGQLDFDYYPVQHALVPRLLERVRIPYPRYQLPPHLIKKIPAGCRPIRLVDNSRETLIPFHASVARGPQKNMPPVQQQYQQQHGQQEHQQMMNMPPLPVHPRGGSSRPSMNMLPAHQQYQQINMPPVQQQYQQIDIPMPRFNFDPLDQPVAKRKRKSNEASTSGSNKHQDG